MKKPQPNIRLPRLSNCPLVSIVTPSYNQAAYLEETICSVLDQDYPFIEYIIIDGGSDDGSVEIIRKYEKRLAYWVSEPDEGQADAINKGFRHANGEIAAWINSDDTYSPGAVQRAVDVFLAYPATAMIYSDCHIIDEQHHVRDTIVPLAYSLEIGVLETRIPQPTVFMRSAVLKEVGFLDPSLHYALDSDLWLRIGVRFGVDKVEGVLANFRIVSGTKSTASLERFGPELLRIYERFFAQVSLPEEIKRLESRVFARVHWRTGVEYYAAGNHERGRFHCANAVEGAYNVFDDMEFALRHLVAQHSVLRDPVLVTTILAKLPLSPYRKLKVKRAVWARYAATRFFQAHRSGRLSEVRRSGLQALVLDPTWVSNPGFLSILSRALWSALRGVS